MCTMSRRETCTNLYTGNHYLRFRNPQQAHTRLVTEIPNKDMYLNDFVWVSRSWEFQAGDDGLYSFPRHNWSLPNTIYHFTQQSLPACKPVLTTAWVIATFFLMGVIFIPIGLVSLHAPQSVVEIVDRYDTDCIPKAFKSNKVAYIKDSSMPQNCSRFLKVVVYLGCMGTQLIYLGTGKAFLVEGPRFRKIRVKGLATLHNYSLPSHDMSVEVRNLGWQTCLGEVEPRENATCPIQAVLPLWSDHYLEGLSINSATALALLQWIISHLHLSDLWVSIARHRP